MIKKTITGFLLCIFVNTLVFPVVYLLAAHTFMSAGDFRAEELQSVMELVLENCEKDETPEGEKSKSADPEPKDGKEEYVLHDMNFAFGPVFSPAFSFDLHDAMIKGESPKILTPPPKA